MPHAPIPSPVWLRAQGSDVWLDVWITPGASRSRVVGIQAGRLKIQLAAPAVENKANTALVRFIADTLGIARAQVEVMTGATHRRKTLRLATVTLQRVWLAFQVPTESHRP